MFSLEYLFVYTKQRKNSYLKECREMNVNSSSHANAFDNFMITKKHTF